MARAIIFDLDGVIFDTEPITATCIQTALRHFDLQEFSAAELALGVGAAGSYRRLLLARKLPVELVDMVLNESSRRFQQAASDLQPIAGVASLITEIQHASLRLALASSARRELICAMLTRADLLAQFKLIVGYEDVDKHKPHAAPYLAAAAGLGFSPSECVAIEDSFVGISSARAAGCQVVALDCAQGATQDFSAANYRVQSLTQLKGHWLRDL